MSFSLPPEISVQRLPLENDMVYQFRHKTLGQLGRIVLQDSPDGRCHISSEVAGDPNDPMTQTRAQIFEPLSQQLSAALESAVGKGQRTSDRQPKPEVSPASSREGIASKQVPCPQSPMHRRLTVRDNFNDGLRHGDVAYRLNIVFD